MNTVRPHTTIGLRKATKSRLDQDRAPGQCYDGFLCQLMDLWEESNSLRPAGAGKPKTRVSNLTFKEVAQHKNN